MTGTRPGPLAPVGGPPLPLRLPDVERTRLDNGFEILAVQHRRLPLADALLVIPTGAGTDSPGLAGRASLTADLLDAGTASRSLVDIARELDRIGARIAVHAHWDYTSLAVQSLPAYLRPALTVLADVATAAAFPAREFDRGRAERLAVILQQLDDPDALADSAIARAVYGADHIYGFPRGGTRSSVERLDRETLVRYHRDRYRPAGAFLVVVGDVAMSAVEAAVGPALRDWRASPSPGAVTVGPVERRPTTIHMLDRPGAPQSELRLGTPGAARSSPDYFPLVVLNTILGGAFTSRLNARLREEGGYTYGAFSSVAFRMGPGPFVAGAAVGTAATDRALAESLEEIERLRDEPVPAAELERAKRFITLGLPRGFERNGGIASRLADTETYGLGQEYWQEYGDHVARVGSDQLRAVARSYLDPSCLAIAVVGDAARVRSPLERLGVGPVLDVQPVD